MKIAGGIYREECTAPYWARLFGSGGRAAAVLGRISPGSEIHAFVYRSSAEDVRVSMGTFGVEAHLTEIDAEIEFRYFHPLSVPDVYNVPEVQEAPLQVTGEAVLRFGFVEGDALVDGERVVHDPQSWRDALAFRRNGSRAGELAVVLNESELEYSTGLNGASAVEVLLKETGAVVVVVKRGPYGSVVYDSEERTIIPAFLSPTVFKIGSGDVFSACFAYQWAERRQSAKDAAHFASLSVSRYVSTRDTQVGQSDELPTMAPVGEPGRVYIAGPFFTLAQRWLVEEAREALLRMRVPVFSPFHEVGTGGSAEEIADRDLEGLRACQAVLALVDGEDAGTMFEIGYARDRGIPVIAFSEKPRPESLTMLQGSGCRIFSDFAAAMYHSIWAACK